MEDIYKNDDMYELVTMEEDIDCLPEKTICKEIIKEEKLVIPGQKPEIEQLAKIIIKPVIKSHKIIDTLTGPKVIVQGKIIEKIFYVADKPEQSVHAAKFSFTFCDFIKLSKKCDKIKEVKVNIEDVIINLKNKREVEKCILLILCAVPEKYCFHDC